MASIVGLYQSFWQPAINFHVFCLCSCSCQLKWQIQYLSIHVHFFQVLSSNIKYPVIPRRVTIGKRLAQCLHPALPSGVHLKVLETYDIIFKCIGTQRLAADLFTYGAGLFPLLGYAAMNVRPSLLSLYEAHFVALRQHIKPALTGLIMGLLPGLEDGSEHSVK